MCLPRFTIYFYNNLQFFSRKGSWLPPPLLGTFAAMALAQLLAAAHCWTPPARPPTFTRRELGSLGAAGLAAASSGGILLPASAGGIPPQPYEKQPGFKLNTGQAFPTASFGLQVYDDATAQKLTSLALEVGHHNLPHLSAAPRLHPSAAPLGTQPFSYTPWPHPVATHRGHTSPGPSATPLPLQVGYRNFFASVLAKNQVGFARAIKESGTAAR